MSYLHDDERKTLEILIVDDDRIVQILHRHILERNNIRQPILIFSHGKAAMDYLRAQQQEKKCFLVLLDINMPVMNAWEFLKACYEEGYYENIYVVIVSSSINIEDKLKAQNFQQVLEFLEKPFSAESVESLREKKELRDYLT